MMQLTKTNGREQRGDSCNTTVAFNTPVGKDAMNSWVTQTLRASISDQHWELIPNSMVHREHAQKQGWAHISRQSRALRARCQGETFHKVRYHVSTLLQHCRGGKSAWLSAFIASHFAKSYWLLSEYLSYLSIWISLGDGKFTVQHSDFPRKAV